MCFALADVNKDARVDADDLVAFATAWGDGSLSREDADSDGVRLVAPMDGDSSCHRFLSRNRCVGGVDGSGKRCHLPGASGQALRRA